MLLLFGSAWPYQQQTPTGVPNSVATATVVVGFWDEMVQSIGVVMKIRIWISWFHDFMGSFANSIHSSPQFGSYINLVWRTSVAVIAWLSIVGHQHFQEFDFWFTVCCQKILPQSYVHIIRLRRGLRWTIKRPSHSEIKQELIKSMLLLVSLNNLCVLGINHRSIKLKWIDWN